MKYKILLSVFATSIIVSFSLSVLAMQTTQNLQQTSQSSQNTQSLQNQTGSLQQSNPGETLMNNQPSNLGVVSSPNQLEPNVTVDSKNNQTSMTETNKKSDLLLPSIILIILLCIAIYIFYFRRSNNEMSLVELPPEQIKPVSRQAKTSPPQITKTSKKKSKTKKKKNHR